MGAKVHVLKEKNPVREASLEKDLETVHRSCMRFRRHRMI